MLVSLVRCASCCCVIHSQKFISAIKFFKVSGRANVHERTLNLFMMRVISEATWWQGVSRETRSRARVRRKRLHESSIWNPSSTREAARRADSSYCRSWEWKERRCHVACATSLCILAGFKSIANAFLLAWSALSFFVSYCCIFFFLPWVGCVGLGSFDC